ncbi:hypothetical protein Tco_0119083, partial [Tanacetum coccineum]
FGSVNIPYLLARYLRLFALGRKRGVMISKDLPMINMTELARMQICEELDNSWDWVAPGPERQQVAAADAPKVTEGALVVDEGAPAVLALVQAPHPPPATRPARTMIQRLGRLDEDVYGLRGALGE